MGGTMMGQWMNRRDIRRGGKQRITVYKLAA
jgi:hypothetical protein